MPIAYRTRNVALQGTQVNPQFIPENNETFTAQQRFVNQMEDFVLRSNAKVARADMISEMSDFEGFVNQQQAEAKQFRMTTEDTVLPDGKGSIYTQDWNKRVQAIRDYAGKNLRYQDSRNEADNYINKMSPLWNLDAEDDANKSRIDRAQRKGKEYTDMVMGMDVTSQVKAENAFRKQYKSTNPSWGLRADGTPKGKGYFGELKMPDGRVATEISIGVDFNGKETQIPTLVPTLTQQEIDYLLTAQKPTKEIIQKAVNFAKQRIAEGKSPFADESDELNEMDYKLLLIKKKWDELADTGVINQADVPDIVQSARNDLIRAGKEKAKLVEKQIEQMSFQLLRQKVSAVSTEPEMLKILNDNADLIKEEQRNNIKEEWLSNQKQVKIDTENNWNEVIGGQVSQLQKFFDDGDYINGLYSATDFDSGITGTDKDGNSYDIRQSDFKQKWQKIFKEALNVEDSNIIVDESERDRLIKRAILVSQGKDSQSDFLQDVYSRYGQINKSAIAEIVKVSKTGLTDEMNSLIEYYTAKIPDLSISNNFRLAAISAIQEGILKDKTPSEIRKVLSEKQTEAYTLSVEKVQGKANQAETELNQLAIDVSLGKKTETDLKNALSKWKGVITEGDETRFRNMAGTGLTATQKDFNDEWASRGKTAIEGEFGFEPRHIWWRSQYESDLRKIALSPLSIEEKRNQAQDLLNSYITLGDKEVKKQYRENVIPRIKNDADYDKLESGQVYYDPKGIRRIKK